ncbi:MAG: type I DNA topoisomerase, partial [Patescibacteria group bacterium]
MSELVIVESPTKAKTISKFLGRDFIVASSFGHVRDLPASRMGINIADDSFDPEYIVPKEKAKVVKELLEKSKKTDAVIFATDEDREGEAISWHLAEVLKLDPKKIKRIAFHEITKHAVEEALAHPRHLDMDLVDAQQARRVLDRLVGYELSPLLWKKVARGLSAGRVQSVAVRLVVERERERQNFTQEEYWTIEGMFGARDTAFPALLHAIDDASLDKLAIKNKKRADEIVKDLDSAAYTVHSLELKETTREPAAPHRTSTLQQDANHKLGMSSAQTMRIAQQLYEGVELGGEGHTGLITYMRTDSTNLSDKFLGEAKQYITDTFGGAYALASPRRFTKQAKGAQEAHEAIRPTDAARTPDSIKTHLAPQQYKLYNLIWRRAIATQMAAPKLDATTIDITAKKYTFRATGQTVVFDGWLKLYPQQVKENELPKLKEGAAVTCSALTPEQHFTEPPARYSDATLVKIMEKLGIGRPST